MVASQSPDGERWSIGPTSSRARRRCRRAPRDWSTTTDTRPHRPLWIRARPWLRTITLTNTIITATITTKILRIATMRPRMSAASGSSCHSAWYYSWQCDNHVRQSTGQRWWGSYSVAREATLRANIRLCSSIRQEDKEKKFHEESPRKSRTRFSDNDDNDDDENDDNDDDDNDEARKADERTNGSI